MREEAAIAHWTTISSVLPEFYPNVPDFFNYFFQMSRGFLSRFRIPTSLSFFEVGSEVFFTE
jgi:hypothetical protein